MRDFIERLQAKPEHTRRQIAFFSSAGITAVVALLWVVGMSSSTSFTLAPTNGQERVFSQENGVGSLVEETSSGFSNLLGAVGAANTGSESASGLTIVDEKASSTLDRNTTAEERTVIPF